MGDCRLPRGCEAPEMCEELNCCTGRKYQDEYIQLSRKDSYRSGVEAGVRAGLEAGSKHCENNPFNAGWKHAQDMRTLPVQPIVEAVLKGDKHG